jgi:predicted component of type VI protein secretion system
MPIELIIREAEGPDRRQLVPGPAAVLGRREDNDVVLPFSFVSARHGRLFLRAGVLHVEDLGSTNGTLVNGVALEPTVPRPLDPGDVVEIDRLVLRARWLEEGGPQPQPQAVALVRGAPAGVWEIQAGALPAAAGATVPVEARPPARAAPAAEPFVPARTLPRVPVVASAGRFRAWAVVLQVVGLLAVVGGLALLLVVLLA